jgi:hypothetical protein
MKNLLMARFRTNIKSNETINPRKKINKIKIPVNNFRMAKSINISNLITFDASIK